MAEKFVAVPASMAMRSTAEQEASTGITSAGSVDSAAMTGAAAAALGPIGVMYLAAYAPAQANNLAATLLLGAVHAELAGSISNCQTAVTSFDSA